MTDAFASRVRPYRRLGAAQQIALVGAAFLGGFAFAQMTDGGPATFFALLALPALAGIVVRPTRRVTLAVATVATLGYSVYWFIVSTDHDGPRLSLETFAGGAVYAGLEYVTVVTSAWLGSLVGQLWGRAARPGRC